MKKLYFLFIVLCLCSAVRGQKITFANSTFKSRLLATNSQNGFARDKNGNNIKIDSNGDKEIDASEALEVYYLDVSTKNNIDPQIFNIIGIEYFTNLRTLYYRSNRVSGADLRPLIYLEDLDCSYNTDFPSGINLEGLNLKRLDASGTGLMKPYLTAEGNVGLSQFPNLETLICNSTTITSMNFSGLKKLKTLNISHNMLKNINLTDLISLEKLDCVSNLLIELDLSACKNLINVNASENQISSLSIQDMPKLENIDMYKNTLLKEATLQNLPYLKNLNINNCILNGLNLSGLSALDSLNCSNNKLLNLDLKKCSSLRIANCSFNELKEINLSDNKSLTNLICKNNKFETLDLSNELLNDINCSNNPSLKYLSIKNGVIFSSLSLSNIPNLKYICVDDNEITTIQNLITQYGYKDCNVNTYCSFHPGGDHFIIQGTQRFDITNNGYDNLDLAFPNLKFNIVGSSSGTFVSDSSGDYLLPVSTGTYTITPVLENPLYFTVIPETATVIFPAEISPYTQNFRIIPNGTYPDLEVNLLPIDVARPGFDATYKIIYKNKGNKVDSGSIQLKFDESILDYLSSDLIVSSQSDGLITWNFENLEPFESKEITITLKVNRPTETPAVNNGDILKLTATIASQDTDETPIDNTFTLNQTVVGSYDPNDKTCLEGDVITPSLIGEYVHYMIRFENTGTYPAQNIVVKDMIDLDKFDISTLIPTSSSHSFVTKISEGNKVEFIFENINLPFDNAVNDGYIAFKIKTKPTLQVGDSFTNDANIYFDYNFPILTNKATSKFQTTLGTPDFEFSNYFTLYPNPASDVLNITATQNIEIQSLAIYDILGQLVIAVPNAKSVSNIDVSKLRTGTYFIKVKSDKGSSSMKFIKK